jgi:CRISPR-associated endonuclease Csn1
MTAYNLGIDIGIASIGFAGVDLANKKIKFCGAHLFEAAENPKDGASLAAPRREKRGMRRVIERRAARKKSIRALLAKHGLQHIEAIDASISTAKTGKGRPPVNPWDLRKEALERKLKEVELARVLFHIAKRRGFQSNRKDAEPNDTEGKKALNGAKELQEAMVRTNALTVGAYLATLPKKRNGDGSYERFVTRDLLREEVRKIFDCQRRLGNGKATKDLEMAYNEIAFFQRPLQSSEHLVGLCALIEGEKRAPKFSYTAELFILWSKLNNARVKTVNGDERPMTQDEKNRLADLAHKNKGGVTYRQVRKELGLTENERFNISYRKIKDEDNDWEKVRDTNEKADFVKLSGYHALKSALDTGSDADWRRWVAVDRDKLDDIARILSFYEDPKQIETMLSDLGLDVRQIQNLSVITNFNKTVDLSLKAIHDILPYMQDGLAYDKACEEAGYNHSRKENKGLGEIPPFDDIRNPVVNRAMAQARKVINACIREHGMPETIIVELARDVGRPFKERKDIEREQKKNQEYRKEAKNHIAEILGILPDNVSGEDILKYRLWKEQQAICCYCGSEIKPALLKDPLSTQIDHIIPYSRSWNDSYMNKVLCHLSCNQEKSNRTPYEWLYGTTRWDALEAFSGQLPQKKAENLLLEKFDEEKAQQWKSRALNDTRYMARLLKNHLEQTLALGNGNRVQTRNGALTAHLRGGWGFPDKNRRNDRHHAIDAIVLACSTQAQVKRFSDWNKYEAKQKNTAERPVPPKPWDTFRDDAMNAVYGHKNEQGLREGGIFVSRMPVRKITGAAHQETIRSIKKLPDGLRQIIQRVKLTGLSPAMLENMVDKERNIKLYNILKERLDAHGGKPDKAFVEPVFMPSNDPAKQGPRVNSIRVITKEKSGIEINGGLASNGDMIRVDVFQKDGKFQLVPIYVHHFALPELPNKAIVAYKDENDWVEMRNEDFLFSLYRNDLVSIKSKKEEALGYYVGTDRSTGAIILRAHDNDSSFGKDGLMRGIGVKTLLAFEKYSVDYFGRKHRIKKELRLGVAHGNDTESGETEPFQGAVAAGE